MCEIEVYDIKQECELYCDVIGHPLRGAIVLDIYRMRILLIVCWSPAGAAGTEEWGPDEQRMEDWGEDQDSDTRSLRWLDLMEHFTLLSSQMNLTEHVMMESVLGNAVQSTTNEAVQSP